MSLLVSVIIPTYNHAHFLGRAIESILNQTYQKFEILIVDNHSSDNTDEVIFSYTDTRIRVLKINNNGIIASSRNLGIKNAKGKYIAFLDSDDWWTPEKLEKCVFQLSLGADVVFHDLYLFKQTSWMPFLRRLPSKELSGNIHECLISGGNAIPNSSAIVTAQALRKVKNLNESNKFVGWEDYDLWLRISLNTSRFVRVKGTLGFYWWGDSNTTTPKASLKNTTQFYNEYILKNGLPMPHWVTYSFGRSYYILKQYDLAQRYLPHIPLNNSTRLLWIKAKLMTIHMLFV